MLLSSGGESSESLDTRLFHHKDTFSVEINGKSHTIHNDKYTSISAIPDDKGYINILCDYKQSIDTIVLLKLSFGEISCNINRTMNLSEYTDTIIQFPETEDYLYSYRESSGRYMIRDYDNARIKGTTITMNDLKYYPNSSHRLCLNSLKYEATKARIHYRSSADKTNNSKNSIVLFGGPSFLKVDGEGKLNSELS